ncbi:hypothetical protein QKX51_005029, partial [Salmonella enterica]|nr:hypothetical protein [Salmonella enterica]
MDESRKQFQSWFADEIVGADVEFPEFEDGEYVAGEIYDEQLYVMLQAMYMAWTASRAAIEINLDDKVMVEDEFDKGHNCAIDYCADAIRAA